MSQGMLLAVLLVALAHFWHAAVTDSAAVGSTNLEELPFEIHPSSLRTQRDTESAGENASANSSGLTKVGDETSKRNCENMACGWAVYQSITRRVVYYMRNTCQCPDKSYKCVRIDDDLSANAYVYRCRQNSTLADLEASEDSN
ncbi:uncharacterized protein LOC105701047 [Orussus abietinus]|uniref:uncharacterized protein LOC105701047 n=1 Tax=Orussus abietinus TaxID=222816 RepID=UPI0006261D9D|nr:uncharacterized protein LOC105701047 [Orussus abietinus]